MSDSDSDRTVDSDELAKFLKGTKHTPLRRRSMKLHEISDEEKSERPSKVERKRRNDKTEKKVKPFCEYGARCYRKNPEHFEEFRHPKGGESVPKKKTKFDSDKEIKLNNGWCKTNNFNFFLTKVNGIKPGFNQGVAFNIKDLLSSSEGKLISSVQFNYMIDMPWLIRQYPPESRSCPLLIVHGEQRNAKRALEQSARIYPNISFCQAKLDIMFGTHHTKMMILLFDVGLRIIIHTANLVEGDWDQKTQGMWISPIFPKLEKPKINVKKSHTQFKSDLINYLLVYNDPSLNKWSETIQCHDLSSANVFLIGSVPGRHTESRKTLFGHLKLRKVLNNHTTTSITSDWPIIGQFSSIGSLGSGLNQWLCGEWLTSLSTVKEKAQQQNGPLKLIFPSVDNVRTSLEGYPAGASLPYSKATASKQPYLRRFLHRWKSQHLGRSYASPHIKSYCRISPDMTKIAWFILTSANLSKAAWGALEKNGNQLMIRSYELGVLFIPKYLCEDEYFRVSTSDEECNFSLPYDIPLTPYSASDEPWIWDAPHTELPDRNGNMWCPTP